MVYEKKRGGGGGARKNKIRQKRRVSGTNPNPFTKAKFKL